ncbi:MAG: hypothetical protein Q8O94_04165 [bacterium]|nr:hypothetical protein [bacterium]
MKILVIEDNKEELTKAKEIIEAMGHEVTIVDVEEWTEYDHIGREVLGAISHDDRDWGGKIDGIITDLNFKMLGTNGRSGITPSGLLVALHAASFGKPVVICTRIEDGESHHGKATSWIYDGYFLQLQLLAQNCGEPEMFSCCPGWVENKDWKKACEELEKKFAAQSSPS